MSFARISVSVLALFLSGCTTVPITGRKQFDIVPAAELAARSSQDYREVIARSKLSDNQEQVELVNRVGARIACAADDFLRRAGEEAKLKTYSWEFALIENERDVNAFSMPGGKMVVYTAMLPLAQGEQGLAVVMSHEAAHDILNHAGERMSQLLLLQLGQTTLSAALGSSPEVTARLLMSAYGAGAQFGVLLPFGRQQELEADRVGLILMSLAGYDPRHAVGFWQRMQDHEQGTPPEFVSTHPATQRRLGDIRARLPESLSYKRSAGCAARE